MAGRITDSFPEFEDVTQRHGMRPIVCSGNEVFWRQVDVGQVSHRFPSEKSLFWDGNLCTY